MIMNAIQTIAALKSLLTETLVGAQFAPAGWDRSTLPVGFAGEADNSIDYFVHAFLNCSDTISVSCEVSYQTQDGKLMDMTWCCELDGWAEWLTKDFKDYILTAAKDAVHWSRIEISDSRYYSPDEFPDNQYL